MVTLSGSVVIALLGLIATINLAQFGLQIKHESRLSTLESRVDNRLRTDGGSGPIRWRHFLTGADDRTIYNVTFLSRPREWHALGFAAIAAYHGISPVGLASGGYSGGRALEGISKSLHAKDAMKELAYVALGAAIGGAVRAVA